MRFVFCGLLGKAEVGKPKSNWKLHGLMAQRLSPLAF
jgi:hypothetical protein